MNSEGSSLSKSSIDVLSVALLERLCGTDLDFPGQEFQFWVDAVDKNSLLCIILYKILNILQVRFLLGTFQYFKPSFVIWQHSARLHRVS